MKTIFGAKNLAELKALLKAGADLHQRNSQGETILHDLAAKNRPVDMFQYALDHGVKLAQRCPLGRTMLHQAALTPTRPEIFELAIRRGADVNAKSKNLCTPLGLAIYRGHLAPATLLFKHGARLGPGDFPLHDMTAGYGILREDLVRFVLDRNLIALDARNFQKQTAMDCARKKKSALMMTLLSEYGAAGAAKAAGYAKINKNDAAKRFAAKKSPLSKKCVDMLSVAFDLTRGDVNFHAGTLASKKPLVLEAPLIVDGDLDVKGWILDTHGVDHNIVFVTGDVRCSGYVGEAEVFVLGSFRIDGDAWLMSRGDNTLHVGGTLTARIIASGGHWLDLQGKLAAKAVVGGLQPSGKTRFQTAFKHKVLHPSLYKLQCSKSEAREMEPDELDDCCEIKEPALIARIKQGKSLGR